MQPLLIKLPQPITELDACQQFLRAFLAKKNIPTDKLIWQFLGFNEKIAIDDLRHLQVQISQSGGQNLTVFVLNRLENTPIVAQNSLLKMLEEPPEQVLFILLTNNLSSVLETISSRCQFYTIDTQKLDKTYKDSQTLLAQLPPLTDWTRFSASHLATTLITSLDKIHKSLNNKDLSFQNYASQALIQLNAEIDQELHTQKATAVNLELYSKLLQGINRSLIYLKFNVSAKNVIYDLSCSLYL